MELSDRSHASKKAKQSIAELTRPARALKQKINTKNKKPQGRKKIHEPRPAKYHNWHTPFCWSQIQLAAKKVGWKMSSSAMVTALRRMDPDTFAGISRTTIEGWIDRTGDRPQWRDAVLQKVEQGNDPGHNKGGRRGVLVHHSAKCMDIFSLNRQ
jgi:hypothetical protein